MRSALAPRTLTYRGDQTAPFDTKSKRGTVGRVVGGRGRWFKITSASYDPETDRTTCVLDQLMDPNVALARVADLSEEWNEQDQ